MASKSLGEFEGLLNSALFFFRIHNTYIVNLSHLLNINKKSGNYCEMSNGDALPISRRLYEGLMKYLRNTKTAKNHKLNKSWHLSPNHANYLFCSILNYMNRVVLR